jgi:hypothetical protein
MPKKKVVNERLANTVKQNQRPEKEVKQKVPNVLKTNWCCGHEGLTVH